MVRKLAVILAMVLVGFMASFAGDISAAFLAAGAPALALLVGGAVVAACIVLALWAVDHV